MDTWIQTHSGGKFFYSEEEMPKSDILIDDIAAALSKINRFCGHTVRPYSVAEHSVRMSFAVPYKLALQALMHDATEAYMQDIPSPLKAMLPDYKAIYARAEKLVFETFGLPLVLDPEVKLADLRALASERDLLMRHSDLKWSCLEGVPPWSVATWRAANLRNPDACYAELAFIARFHELTKNRK